MPTFSTNWCRVVLTQLLCACLKVTSSPSRILQFPQNWWIFAVFWHEWAGLKWQSLLSYLSVVFDFCRYFMCPTLIVLTTFGPNVPIVFHLCAETNYDIWFRQRKHFFNFSCYFSLNLQLHTCSIIYLSDCSKMVFTASFQLPSKSLIIFFCENRDSCCIILLHKQSTPYIAFIIFSPSGVSFLNTTSGIAFK